MRRYFLLYIATIAILFSSCSSTNKNLLYFNGANAIDTTQIITTDFLIKVQPDDELSIVVSSLVPEASAHYNLLQTNPAVRGSLIQSAQAQNQTYVVSKDGYINFPVFGKLMVKGLTTEEITDMLYDKIKEDIADPNIRVELVNFKINLLGEVKIPGMIDVDRQRFTVLDAIAAAGDLTEYAERTNLLLIREENGERSYVTIDLNDTSLFNSPYFYLQQNDVIYVRPNKIKEDNSRYNTNNAFKLSLTSTIVSAASVIASLIIALVL
ncbi:MAG: polysaccharide biosynthesis/export family protein [Bacteroidales bacterium]